MSAFEGKADINHCDVHAWRAAQACLRGRPVNGGQIHGQTMRTAQARMACLSAQPHLCGFRNGPQRNKRNSEHRRGVLSCRTHEGGSDERERSVTPFCSVLRSGGCRRFRAKRPRRCARIHQEPAAVGALSGSSQRQPALRQLPSIPAAVVVQGSRRQDQPKRLVQHIRREGLTARFNSRLLAAECPLLGL